MELGHWTRLGRISELGQPAWIAACVLDLCCISSFGWLGQLQSLLGCRQIATLWEFAVVETTATVVAVATVVHRGGRGRPPTMLRRDEQQLGLRHDHHSPVRVQVSFVVVFEIFSHVFLSLGHTNQEIKKNQENGRAGKIQRGGKSKRSCDSFFEN